MKIAGIIGGLGPGTTSEFYMKLISGCYEAEKIARPPILIWSVPLEYEIERGAIVDAAGIERCAPYLTDAARRLETGGADFLAMPCNSLHIYIDKIRESVEIPALSIVEETARFLKAKKIRKAGVLATSASLKHKLYGNALAKEGIEQVLPDEFEQEKIGRIVENLVLGKGSNKDRTELMDIVDDFEKRGVKDVILACTDLQLLIPKHERLRIFDTMDIFASTVVKRILS